MEFENEYDVTRKLEFSIQTFDSLPDLYDATTTYPVWIKFASCTTALDCQLVDFVDDKQIWSVITPNMPQKTFAMSQTNEAIKYFVMHYGHMDEKGCIHTGSGTIDIGRLKRARRLEFDKKIFQLDGVKQPRKDTGLCWWSAFCFVFLMNDACRNLLKRKTGGKTHSGASVPRLLERCLHDERDSEKLRKFLYLEYQFGDPLTKKPHEQGQNGCGQFFVLCAKLDIPVVRLMAPSMHQINMPVFDNAEPVRNSLTLRATALANEHAFLVVRCFRTTWKPVNRFKHNNRIFKLVGILIGSEYCGHQIGVSIMPGLRLGVSDADGIAAGVFPSFWRIDRNSVANSGGAEGVAVEGAADASHHASVHDRWVDSLDKNIPVCVFGNFSKHCNFGVLNRIQDAPTQLTYRNARSHGVVNSDFVYISAPTVADGQKKSRKK